MTAVTALHLVRHGESAWNAAGLLQGRTAHVPLSARGRAQAARCAAVLADVPVAAVLSSDQVRALDSAAPIASAHGLPVRAEPALREQGHGAWEGRRAAGRAAVLARAGPDWAPAGGETGRAVRTRVGAFLDRLFAGQLAGEVVLVTHGETVRALRAVLTGHPGALPGNGQLLTLRYAARGWTVAAVAVPPHIPDAGDAALPASV